ncbi:hypothetical protein PC116_g13420 [Phytophthora cactorum]|uniref:Uncharacterized protein n=1 Tax=Phytophthora cactorum TaxID=29920 RepID=A0A8T1KNW1_9STRA|nr:hypothetical protein Pcac1_g18829 [Phytophthora cactorum]KAG2890654.1 hypothetical protein PC114_g17348 [Phytophthora cactorum]KAG2939103.1 hypothetical protein PC117_g11033 [Phytophthora cactorum]KAG2998807.1 hypothetical protein PC119_g17385 [Phytophthora cactorum]KAG3001799.1 hypothetical protein PC120_g20067 [Phytophthora cactorum]
MRAHGDAEIECGIAGGGDGACATSNETQVSLDLTTTVYWGDIVEGGK